MAGTCDLLRGRKKILLAKVETTELTDPTPTPAANAILVNSVEIRHQPNLLETNELTGKLDAGEFDVGGFPTQLVIQVNCKPGTSGAVAPEAGVLLKACGLQEVTTAAINGDATGGTTTTVTVDRSVDTGFPATEGALVGMPITIATLMPTPSLIKSYAVSGNTVTMGLAQTLTGAPTTEQVDVLANILYKGYEGCPPTLTVYVYVDGTLWKFVGCRGNAEWTVDAGGKLLMTVTLTGFFVSRTDVALPTSTVVYQDVRPGIWKNGLMSIESVRAAVQQLTMNLGNLLPYPGDPNQVQGFMPAVITGRDQQGRINPFETLVATRNIVGDFANGTKKALGAIIPGASSSYTGLMIPAAKYRDASPEERDELVAVGAPFSAINDSGENPELGDNGFFLSFFYGS